jgi:zinc protease
VTAEQVQQVARKYLNEDNLTIAMLDPLPMKKHGMPARGHMGGDHVR